MVYVVWAGHMSCHYVSLCLEFKRMAHGMFNIAFGPSTGWQMVLALVHPILNVVPIVT
jgi:hypothetical protein